METPYKFVKKPEFDLHCLICRRVAQNPQQETSCGKLFCTSCLDELGEGQSCPYCRHEHPRYCIDKKSDMEIKDLLVKCRRAGCSWTGALRDAPDHVTRSCNFAIVKCKYHDIGCTEKTTRKRMKKHEKDVYCHFPLFNKVVKIIQDEADTACGPGKILRMENFDVLRKQSHGSKSYQFYSHPNGYNLCLEVFHRNTEDTMRLLLDVWIVLLNGPHDKNLPWPFKGDIKLDLFYEGDDTSSYETTQTLVTKDNILPPQDASFEQKTLLEVNLRFSYIKPHRSDTGSYTKPHISDTGSTEKHSIPNSQYMYFKVFIRTEAYRPQLMID